MQKKNIFNSPRLLELKKNQKKIFQYKIFFILFFFLLIIIASVLLLRIEKLNIKEINISGNKVIETEDLKKIVEKELENNYLFILPKTNILFYPKEKIKKELFKEYKRIENITLSIGNNNILEILIKERSPLYTYCGILLSDDVEGNSECYFLDKNGFIFDKAPYFSGEVYFKFYGELDSIDDKTIVGNYFLPDIFSKITSFKEVLESLKIKPISFYLKDDNIEIYFSRIDSSNKPKIIFKKDGDFQKILENLQIALNTEPLKTDFINKYSSLLYIDLRFGNKIYFKFND